MFVTFAREGFILEAVWKLRSATWNIFVVVSRVDLFGNRLPASLSSFLRRQESSEKRLPSGFPLLREGRFWCFRTRLWGFLWYFPWIKGLNDFPLCIGKVGRIDGAGHFGHWKNFRKGSRFTEFYTRAIFKQTLTTNPLRRLERVRRF